MDPDILKLTAIMTVTKKFAQAKLAYLEREVFNLDHSPAYQIALQSVNIYKSNRAKQEINTLKNAYYYASIVSDNAVQIISKLISNEERKYLAFIDQVNKKYAFNVTGLQELVDKYGLGADGQPILAPEQCDIRPVSTPLIDSVISYQQETLSYPVTPGNISISYQNIPQNQCSYVNGAPVLPEIPDK